MLPIIPTIIATKSGLDILIKAKEWFYPDNTLREAEAILSKRMAEDVGSLQEQMRIHRQVIDKLGEQVKADKDLIEKHNEVLIQLSETTEQIAVALSRLRMVSYWGIGSVGLALVVAVLVWCLK